MASFHNDQSFLRKAGTRKFFLDINNLPKIPKSISDRLYTIESKYENRPDLLAHDLFGSVQLWWVFALRNPDIIIDPLTDFTSGKQIYIPPRETIDRVL
tara:strand:+ start:1615 stop:1911 length:297 start_codon:yes stop_codon:yes gene_type:complete